MDGMFPAQSHSADPADHRWRRYADCHDLLERWLSDDLKDALARQERRLELVEEVKIKLAEERDHPLGQDLRERESKTNTQAQVFQELEEETGIRAYTLRRQYRTITETKLFMSGLAPIALVQTDGKYRTEFFRVGRPGGIYISVRKPRSRK